MRILLLDDHPVIRQALHCLLENITGVRVIGSAASAAEGLRHSATLKPDFILTDYHLQDHDAPWFIRQLAPLKNPPPVIVLSTRTEEDIVIQCLEAGARSYLPKYCSTEDLKLALREVTRGETYLHPEIAAKATPQWPPRDTRQTRRQTLISRREKELLLRIVEGQSNRTIADELQLSLSTVKAHMRNVFRKLDVDDRAKALAKALRLGILEPGEDGF